jgi:hypothetical protein
LDWGEISTDDFGGWVFVGEISGQSLPLDVCPRVFGASKAHIAHIPVPVPMSTALCRLLAYPPTWKSGAPYLEIPVNWREEKFTV